MATDKPASVVDTGTLYVAIEALSSAAVDLRTVNESDVLTLSFIAASAADIAAMANKLDNVATAVRLALEEL